MVPSWGALNRLQLVEESIECDNKRASWMFFFYYYYYIVAALGVLNFGYFLICANWYKYKGGNGVAIEMTREMKQSEKNSA